jgi:hypothetical protein
LTRPWRQGRVWDCERQSGIHNTLAVQRDDGPELVVEVQERIDPPQTPLKKGANFNAETQRFLNDASIFLRIEAFD